MSVENINPYNKYQGNGVATEFSVDFPYNNKTDVVVYLKNEGEAQQTLVVNTDYTWLNDTTIKTTTAPADGSILAIYRETPAASDYNFENQRRLFPEEVTNSDNLAILLIQELRAMFSRTLTVDETSTVTPEELVDELNSLVTTAAGYVSQCSGYSDLAQAWATKTDGPVSGGEYSSKYYAEQIIPMASDINTVVTNISDINTAAANITDIQNASANALLAKDWAIKMDGVVEGSDYSAKYNAGLAATSANNASISETNAANSAILAQQYGNDKINQTHISNCITYIPQDIKLELDNGTLTLKAGSKIYVPNGVGVFDIITIANDISVSGASTLPGAVRMLYYVGDNNIAVFATNLSGTTPPVSGTNQVFYNASDNTIKRYINGSVVASGYSLPLALIKDDGTYLHGSIEQIFNGFGYIGSTIYALPGVKGLIPDDRNADGTLKSIEFTYTELKTYTVSGTNTYYIRCGNNYLNAFVSSTYYDEVKNEVIYNNNKQSEAICGIFSFVNSQITSFTPKTVFHSLDYNDTRFIGHQAMPSDRYTDLTLGASGTTYTAPADGFFSVKTTSSSTVRHNLILKNNTNKLESTAFDNAGWEQGTNIKVKKGDSVNYNYQIESGTFASNNIYFVYAEGSK